MLQNQLQDTKQINIPTARSFHRRKDQNSSSIIQKPLSERSTSISNFRYVKQAPSNLYDPKKIKIQDNLGPINSFEPNKLQFKDLSEKGNLDINQSQSQDVNSAPTSQELMVENQLIHKSSFSQSEKGVHKPIPLKKDLTMDDSKKEQDNSSTVQIQEQTLQQNYIQFKTKLLRQKFTLGQFGQQFLQALHNLKQEQNYDYLELLKKSLQQNQQDKDKNDSFNIKNNRKYNFNQSDYLNNEDRRRGRPKKRNNPFIIYEIQRNQNGQFEDRIVEGWNIRKILKRDQFRSDKSYHSDKDLRRDMRECPCCKMVVKRHLCSHSYCQRPCLKQQSEDRMRKFYLKKKHTTQIQEQDKSKNTISSIDDLNQEQSYQEQ